MNLTCFAAQLFNAYCKQQLRTEGHPELALEFDVDAVLIRR